VFGASLNGLVTHPVRYGWNWTLLIAAAVGVPLGIAAGNLVTAVPASVAARTRPAALLRAE
jgi:hypothetical protein